MFRFAVKNAFRRKSIAILSIIGVAIGVTLMTTMSSIGSTITDQVNQFATAQLDLITVQQQGQLYSTSQFNLTDLANITEIDHVEAYSAQVIAEVSFGTGQFNPSLVGINIQNDTAVGGATSNIVEGTVFQNDNQCIASKTAATFGEVEIGDEVPFLTPSYEWVNLTVVGFYEPPNLLEMMNVYTTIDTVRKFKAGFTNDTYSVLLIRSDSPDNVEYIKNEINRIIDEEGLLVELVLFEEQLELITQFTGTMSIMVLAISVIAGIAGGMSIIVAMLMSVIERMKEFATLKATGWQNRHVIKDIVYESLIVTAIGGMIGFGLAVLFLQFTQGFGAISINPLNVQTITLISVFVVVLGIVGGLYPAYKASKVSPVEILRGE
ncbi:MAG: ABC transporter permease [Candidatus Hodarchaeota archaeon]